MSEKCKVCDGLGTIPPTDTGGFSVCPICDGTGQLMSDQFKTLGDCLREDAQANPVIPAAELARLRQNSERWEWGIRNPELAADYFLYDYIPDGFETLDAAIAAEKAQ